MNKLLMALTGMLLVLACSRESNLIDPKADLKSFVNDSLPGDSTPVDTTVDSTFKKIQGLFITPSSFRDSIIRLHIETSTHYPVVNTKLLAHFNGYSLDSLSVRVYGVLPLFPYTPGNAPAKADLMKRWTPGVNVPLSITLLGTAYTGSISINGPNYTISWAHDSVIHISPKTFPRW